MGANTKIEWATHSYNPWHGCTKVSPACDHCYAETLAKRVGFSETGSKFPIWGKDTDRRFFGDAHWGEPLKWEREAEKSGERPRVFCGSMCDVMEDYNGTGHLVKESIAESRAWLYRLIERTPHLDWLLLTKRPQNFRRFLPQAWLDSPRANVWLLTTVESEQYLWRVRELLKTPAVVHGLSCEPLLGPLDLGLFLPAISWVIVGGESGPGARAMHPDWVRSLRDQCAAAGVAFLFKQWGTWWPISRTDGIHELPFGEYDPYTPHGFIRQGKKHSGRLLDGVEHNGLPEVVSV